MIICSCNVFDDTKIRAVVSKFDATAAHEPDLRGARL